MALWRLFAGHPPQLVEANPGHQANQHHHTSNNDGPELDAQYARVEGGLSSRTDSCQHQHCRHIASDSVVLVQRLRIIDAPVQAREEVLRDANKSLQEQEDVCHETENGVRGFEMGSVVVELVVFDDNEAGEGGQDGDIVQGGVHVGSLLLLFGGVGWLEDEEGLDEEEQSGGVEELQGCGQHEHLRAMNRWTYRMGGEEHQVVAEDCSPYDSCYDPCACLGDDAGACVHAHQYYPSIWNSGVLSPTKPTQHEVHIERLALRQARISSSAKQRLLFTGAMHSRPFCVRHIVSCPIQISALPDSEKQRQAARS